MDRIHQHEKLQSIPSMRFPGMTDSHIWSDGTTDPCTSGISDSGRTDGQPENIKPTAPIGHGAETSRNVNKCRARNACLKWYCYINQQIVTTNTRISHTKMLALCTQCWRRGVSNFNDKHHIFISKRNFKYTVETIQEREPHSLTLIPAWMNNYIWYKYAMKLLIHFQT